MATSVESLEAEVLRLSPADRARLLARLIASLDADAEIEAAWDVHYWGQVLLFALPDGAKHLVASFALAKSDSDGENYGNVRRSPGS